MRGKIRWCCRPRCFQWTGKLNPCKPLLRCMHSRYCFCGPEHGLSHSSGVPCAPRQEDARPARPALPKFAVVRYKPDGDQVSSLAVLVYRLVCQPVTLESWVRLPDAARRSAPAPQPGWNKHRQTASKDARVSFLRWALRFFAMSLLGIFSPWSSHNPCRVASRYLNANHCSPDQRARVPSHKEMLPAHKVVPVAVSEWNGPGRRADQSRGHRREEASCGSSRALFTHYRGTTSGRRVCAHQW